LTGFPKQPNRMPVDPSYFFRPPDCNREVRFQKIRKRPTWIKATFVLSRKAISPFQSPLLLNDAFEGNHQTANEKSCPQQFFVR
jgi:hypothetical protein